MTGLLGKEEALKAWEFYAADLLRWVASRTDKRGIAAIFEAVNMEEARKAVESMPMVNVGFIAVVTTHKGGASWQTSE